MRVANGSFPRRGQPIALAILQASTLPGVGLVLITGRTMIMGATGYKLRPAAAALPDWLGPRLFAMAFTTKTESARHARQIALSCGIGV